MVEGSETKDETGTKMLFGFGKNYRNGIHCYYACVRRTVV